MVAFGEKKEDMRDLIEYKWYSKVLEPTNSLTSAQIAWIVAHTYMWMLICFGESFALGYMVFAGRSAPVVFGISDALITQCGLVVLVSVKLNWIFTCSFLSLDVLNGKVAPLSSSSLKWFPAKTSKWHWWFDLSEVAIIKNDRSFGGRFCDNNNRQIPYELFANLILIPIFTGQ